MTGQDNNNDRFDVFKQLNDINRQNLKYLTGTLPPFAAALAKWNLEMLRFSAQRALEYRELSSRLSQCSSPADLWKEQARFFEHMQAEYSEEMGRLLDLLNGISNVSPQDGEPATDWATATQPQSAPADSSVASQTAQASAEAVSQTAETARQMAGAASEAAEHVTEEARAAIQHVDKDAPGVPQAQAAIEAAETAANTIARQAEATAALMAGSAAAMGGAMAGEARAEESEAYARETSDGTDTAESDEISEDDDADIAGSLIAESSPVVDSADESDDDAGAGELEDDAQSAEAMISEPEPEQDDETAEDSGGEPDDDGPSRSSAGGGVSDPGEGQR